jgi:hypothetical protein
MIVAVRVNYEQLALPDARIKPDGAREIHQAATSKLLPFGNAREALSEKD